MKVYGQQGKLIKAWVDGVEFEAQAMEQVQNVAGMPFVHHHVAVMPDVHWGMGATVGSVIPTLGALIPAAVGVDIGCGILAVRTNLTASDLPDNLSAVRSAIEAAVPHGRTDNGGANDQGSWRGSWQETPGGPLWGKGTDDLGTFYNRLTNKHPKIVHRRPVEHLGTLGTGNHFIEVCLDEGELCSCENYFGVPKNVCPYCHGHGGKRRVWIMLHSGSRGPGNRIGQYFIELAKREMERWFIHLPDKDLAYLPEGSDLFNDYVNAVSWAQDYAATNRALMLNATVTAIAAALGREVKAADVVVNCHHNYVSKEHHFGENVWVTRKGAVRARQGDLGIIPGSMGARSYIVRGLGNADSFNSCSHGAGRRMSRGEARKRFTVDDHAAATAGVECRKDNSVLDETPGAYKSIDAVMEAQKDLVEVVHTLKQVLCVKG